MNIRIFEHSLGPYYVKGKIHLHPQNYGTTPSLNFLGKFSNATDVDGYFDYTGTVKGLFFTNLERSFSGV